MDEIPHAPMKQCSACEQPFPLTFEFFPRHKSHKDGFGSQCKKCTSDYKKQHYQSHKAEISQQHKIYRETHDEQVKESKKRYYEMHRDEDNTRRRAYRQSHLAQEREHGKLYRESHVEEMRARKKIYRESHKEQIAARMRKWQQGEVCKSYRKRYHLEHAEEISKKRRRNYLLHREDRCAYSRAYLKTERGRLVDRAHRHRRKAQKRSSMGFYTSLQLHEQLKRQRSRCYYCKAKLIRGWHADHVVPLSRGGSNDISNIVVACPTCNMRKNDKLPHEWAEGGRLI